MSLKYELSDTTIYEPYTSPPRRWDTEPYGEDPVLASTSSIYFGKLEPERFYHPSERYLSLSHSLSLTHTHSLSHSLTLSRRINKTIIISDSETETTLSTPRGFWPHSYVPRASLPSSAEFDACPVA